MNEKVEDNTSPLSGNLTTRIVWSILVEVLLFVVTVVLAMVDSSDWPDVFFWLTIGTVVALNSESGAARGRASM